MPPWVSLYTFQFAHIAGLGSQIIAALAFGAFGGAAGQLVAGLFDVVFGGSLDDRLDIEEVSTFTVAAAVAEDTKAEVAKVMTNNGANAVFKVVMPAK